jgi:hypothetical protein
MWKCAQCGKEAPPTARQLRRRYCSRACVSAGYKTRLRGDGNPNYKASGVRICYHCLCEYASYNKRRLYCSIQCRDKAKPPQIRGGARKDANHDEIVAAFKSVGANVIDLSNESFGVPDLLVGLGGETHLIEIKNPKTAYGRRGFTKSQAAWADEWRGGPVALVTDVDSALRFARLLAFEPEKVS